MARRILVVPVNHGSGVTAACLGLVHALESRHVPVGYCKPFAQARGVGEDHSTDLVRLATSLRPPQPIPAERLEAQLAGGSLAATMTSVVALIADLDADNRVLVLEGLAPSVTTLYADRINVEVAQALDAEVVLVASAAGLAPERFADRVAAADQLYQVRGQSRLVGVVVNHVPAAEETASYVDALRARGLPPVAAVTDHAEFIEPRLLDLVRALGLEALPGADLTRRVSDTIIAAQAVPGFIPSLGAGRLVVAPGDRHDVLLSAALAEMSGVRLAGLLLTAGIAPHPDVLALVRPALDAGLPLLLTEEKTFPTAQRILELDREIPADDEDRARAVMTVVAEAYDDAWLRGLGTGARAVRTTPAELEHRLRTRLRTGRTRIALTDGAEPRVLYAVCGLQDRESLRFTLVASPSRVEAECLRLGLELPFGVTVVDPEASLPGVDAARERVLAESGVDLAAGDPLLTGLVLMLDGDVDGVVGGIAQDRDEFLATVRALVPLHNDEQGLSSAQTAMLPDEAVLFADGLITPHPTAEQLASIAAQTADTARLCGIAPHVAFIAPSSWSPTANLDRQAISTARDLLAERRPDLRAEGPSQFLQASRRAGASEGNPTVFVFPDIASAAATAKALSQGTGMSVRAPMLQGLSKAVNLLPRDAGVDAVKQLIEATAVRAADLG